LHLSRFSRINALGKDVARQNEVKKCGRTSSVWRRRSVAPVVVFLFLHVCKVLRLMSQLFLLVRYGTAGGALLLPTQVSCGESRTGHQLTWLQLLVLCSAIMQQARKVRELAKDGFGGFLLRGSVLCIGGGVDGGVAGQHAGSAEKRVHCALHFSSLSEILGIVD
jgi:hypothetical protein